jgi:diguanylate cyclase (GGDEF)-like protein/PAS domain S-box-containing protein
MDSFNPHPCGEDALHSALASIPDVSVIVLDADLQVRSLHGNALQRNGHAHERMIGQALGVVMPRPLWQVLEPLCARALAGQTVTFEQAALDGTAIYRSTLSPVQGDGQVVGVTITSLDITARRATENELAELRAQVPDVVAESECAQPQASATDELFETAFASAPAGMLVGRVLDDGTVDVSRCNPAFAAMLGREPAELLGGGAPFVHPDDLSARRRLLDDVLAGRTASAELRYTHADGHDICVLTVPSVVEGAEGERTVIMQMLDVSEPRRLEQLLQEVADRDPLTGLFSRRRFQEELEREVSRARRHCRPGALLVLDLDGFREVNDSLGHAAGDELLTRLGEALRSILRDSDVLGRIGGDEFALILPDTDEAAARVVAEKLIDAVRARGSVSNGVRRAAVTASIGITPVTGGPELDVAKLLIESDLAMYHAKESGKNRIAFYVGSGVVASS